MSNAEVFEIENGVLKKYKGKDSCVVIPDGVTSIGDDAFEWCSNLNSITLPEGLKSIGSWAFTGCTNLTNITIPDGVTSIGEKVFWDCSLTSITIPKSVSSIARSALAFSGVKEIDLYDSTNVDMRFLVSYKDAAQFFVPNILLLFVPLRMIQLNTGLQCRKEGR